MDEGTRIAEWERVMGRRASTAATVPLGLTFVNGNMRVVLDTSRGRVPSKLIKSLLKGVGA